MKQAALTGALRATQHLIARGVDVNAADDAGRCALILAASRGHIDVCRFLLDAGADPFVLDGEGKSAVDVAIRSGFLDLAALLTERQSLLRERLDPPAPAAIAVESVESVPVDAGTVDEIDTSLWEEESPANEPAQDDSCLQEVADLQRDIAAHSPLDTGEDWSDFELELPEVKSRKGRRRNTLDDIDKSAVRTLVLRGLRAGRVSSWRVADAVLGEDGEPDKEYEDALVGLLDSLQIEIDSSILGWKSPIRTKASDWYVERLADEAVELLEEQVCHFDAILGCYLFDVGAVDLLSRDEEDALWRKLAAGQNDVVVAASLSVRAITEILRIAGDHEGESAVAGGVDAQAVSVSDREPAIVAEDLVSGGGEEDDEAMLKAFWGKHTRSSPFWGKIHHIRSMLSSLSYATREQMQLALQDLSLPVSLVSHLIEHLASFPDEAAAREKLASASVQVVDARNRLVASSLRLAYSIAIKFGSKRMPQLDLIQEASLGLMKAVDRFDFRRGYRLSTYATWWIRQFVFRAIGVKSRLIRSPLYIQDLQGNIRKLVEEAYEQTGREPDVAAIAKTLSASGPRVDSTKVEFALQCSLDVVSIAHWSSDAGMASSSTGVEAGFHQAEDIVVSGALPSLVTEVLKTIPVHEAKVLRLRFGLSDGRARSLEEVGRVFGVSRERIRQIESKALSRLRVEERSTRLASYFYDYPSPPRRLRLHRQDSECRDLTGSHGDGDTDR